MDRCLPSLGSFASWFRQPWAQLLARSARGTILGDTVGCDLEAARPWRDDEAAMVRPSRVAIALLVGGAFFTAALLVDRLDRAAVPPVDPTDNLAAAVLPRGTQAGWDVEFVAPARVEVLGERLAIAGPAPDLEPSIESRGVLSDLDLKRARKRLDPDPVNRALLAAQERVEATGDLSDYAAFLLEVAAEEKIRAAAVMLERGEYVILPAYSSVPKLPDGFLSFAMLAFHRREPKEACDVRFCIPRSEFPRLDAAWTAYLEALAAAEDEDCRRFNQLDLAVRAARIKAHDDALRLLTRQQSLSQAELEAALRARIPGKFRIERRFSLLRVCDVTPQ